MLRCKISNTALRLIVFPALFIFLLITALLPMSQTLAADPVVSTGSATDITESAATLNGTLSDFGTVSSTYVYLNFDYCTDDYYDTYGSYDQVTEEIVWTVSYGTTTFTTEITGLFNSTDYHFRAKLRYGTTYFYGTDQTFSTNILPPDSMPEILLLQAYKDLIETDDCLFLILADIPYNTLPNIPVNRSFVWSLIYTGVGQIGWNVGYSMHDLGYNLNLFALYFDAADSIDWVNDTDYYIALEGTGVSFPTNPPLYDVTDSPEYAVTSDTWVSSTDYNTKLSTDLLSIMSTLEQEWQITLLDEQDTKTVLSSNGEKFLRNVIPGVQFMAQGIFFVQNLSIEADVAGRTWGTSLDQTYKQRLLGPDGQPGGGDDNWIAGSFLGVADWLNVPWLVFMGIVCLGICAFVTGLSVRKYQSPTAGYIASLLVVMCFGLLVLGLVLVGFIAFVIVAIAGWYMFKRKD